MSWNKTGIQLLIFLLTYFHFVKTIRI